MVHKSVFLQYISRASSSVSFIEPGFKTCNRFLSPKHTVLLSESWSVPGQREDMRHCCHFLLARSQGLCSIPNIFLFMCTIWAGRFYKIDTEPEMSCQRAVSQLQSPGFELELGAWYLHDCVGFIPSSLGSSSRIFRETWKRAGLLMLDCKCVRKCVIAAVWWTGVGMVRFVWKYCAHCAPSSV